MGRNDQNPTMDSSSSTAIVTTDNNNPLLYKMYRRRWIGMAVIVGLNIATGFVWLTFNAVADISTKWLNAGLTEVNLSSQLYFAGSIFTSLFSGYIFEKYGIKIALIVGGSLNVIGCVIRYCGSFIESSQDSNQARIVVILFGQFIAACAQPFFLNAAPKYSAIWFNDKSRALATTIGTVSNPLGIAVAMVVIPAICSNENGDDVPLTLLVVGIIGIATLVPAFFIPTAPPTPPSASAEIALIEARDESFLVALKKVYKNGQFWILFAAFSISVGIFNTITSLINQIVEPYGYSDDDAGLFGACFILVGIFGAAGSGVYVDRTRKYKEMLKTAAPLLALGYIGLIFVVRRDFFPWICVVCGFLGFVSFALLPVALELGVETTHPSPPSTPTSVLWAGGQTCAVVFLLVGDQLRDSSPFKDEPEDTMTTGLICVAVMSTLTCFLAFFFHSPYHRLEAEAARLKNNAENNGYYDNAAVGNMSS